MVIIASQQINNSPSQVLQKNPPSRICFAQTQDKFESSQKKEEKNSQKTLLMAFAAATVVIGAILTKGKLWGKVAEEVTPPKKATPTNLVSQSPAPKPAEAAENAVPEILNPASEPPVVTKASTKDRCLKISEAYKQRAIKYQEEKNFPKALTAYNKAINFGPDNYILYNNRALVHEEMDNVESALADYDKAIEKNPNDATAFFNKGNVLRDTDPKTAINYAEEAIRLEGANELTLGLKYHILDNLGVDVTQLLAPPKKYSEAQILQKRRIISCLEAKIEKTPNSPDLYGQIANSYEDLGDHRNAIINYEQVVKISPEIPETYSHLGSLYSKLGNIDKALENYTKAIELKPQNPVNYYNRGQLFMQVRPIKPEEALADANKAIELKPNDVAFYSLRIKLYNYLEKTAERDADMKTLRELDKATPPTK